MNSNQVFSRTTPPIQAKTADNQIALDGERNGLDDLFQQRHPKISKNGIFGCFAFLKVKMKKYKESFCSNR
jgi:hypothetical protein